MPHLIVWRLKLVVSWLIYAIVQRFAAVQMLRMTLIIVVNFSLLTE